MIFIKGSTTKAFTFKSNTHNIGNSTSYIPTPFTTSGAAVGDLLVIFIWTGHDAPLKTPVLPAGWTQASVIASDTDARAQVIYKVLDGTETSNITVWSGNNIFIWQMLVFSHNMSTFVVGNVTAEATDGNPSGQTVTIAALTDPVIVLAMAASQNGSATVFSLFSPAYDNHYQDTTFATSYSCDVAYKIYNTSPSNVSLDMSDMGTSNTLISFYLKGT